MTKENLIIDLDVNFWEVNPFFITPFSNIYNEDSSPNKEDSSRLMWAFTLLYHQNSVLKELSFNQKLKEIKHWFHQGEIDLVKYEEDVTRFINITVSWDYWYLVQWRKKLEEREEFIKSTPYNAETFELLEKLLGNSKKIWDQYLAAEKETQKSANEGSVEGNIQESATELGLI